MLAIGAAVVSAAAQQTMLLPSPSDVTTDQANSILGGAQHQINPADYNAPHELFKTPAPSQPLPPVALPANQDPSVKDALDKRKNWTLLTPEQILGVQTPEQILGVANPNGGGKLSLEEQFLLREKRASVFGATNGQPNALKWRDDVGLSGRNKDGQNPLSRGASSQLDDKLRLEAGQYLKQLLNAGGGTRGDGQKQQDSAWAGVFAQPSQPRQTPEQLADMERFRAMLEPSPVQEQATTPTLFSTPALKVVDPYLQVQPAFNPAVRAAAPLWDNISRPSGIQPLPGITGPVQTPPSSRPAWQAQLPPWLQNGPPSHDANRNF